MRTIGTHINGAVTLTFFDNDDNKLLTVDGRINSIAIRLMSERPDLMAPGAMIDIKYDSEPSSHNDAYRVAMAALESAPRHWTGDYGRAVCARCGAPGDAHSFDCPHAED